jgi:hypothetical protein
MDDHSKPTEPLAPLEPPAEDAERLPWHEGPDVDAPEGSWLALDDDGLLHRIETLGSEENEDDHLLVVVASHRHFFIRQEAAKRVHDLRRLFAYEDDRHVGQILVRHLTRREDLTYLERLAIRSRHVEVRSAAQVQLARVWRRLEAPRPTLPGIEPIRPLPVAVGSEARSAPPQAVAPVAPVTPVTRVTRLTSAALEPDGVDASLLSWATHFIVESAWGHLGTTATRELLRQTQAELLPRHERLGLFTVGEDAHVTGEVVPAARVAPDAVQDVAAWMVAFRRAAAKVAPDVRTTSLRACTSLMADALRGVGFYAACDAAEGALR